MKKADYKKAEIADNPCDEQCSKCKEFFTLNFYED